MTMGHDFDPVNDPADSLYLQIRDKAIQIQALNPKIQQLTNQLNALKQQRQILIDEIKALRDGMMDEITGVTVGQ